MILALRNDGRGSARGPYLAFRVEPPYTVEQYGVDGNGREALPRLTVANDRRPLTMYGGGADVVIHTGTVLDVAAVSVRDKIPPTEILYEIATQDMPLFEGRVLIDQDFEA